MLTELRIARLGVIDDATVRPPTEAPNAQELQALRAAVAQAGLLTTVTEGPGHFWLMAGLGVLTAVPLILFSAAARSLTLTTLGMLQYTAPILQFLVAVTVLGEQMPAARWAGFGLIWLSLAVFTVDQLNASRLQRRAVRAGQGAHA